MKKKRLVGVAACMAVLATVSGVLLYVVLHQVRGNFLNADGVKIHYTDQGKGDPVILVHGYSANSDLNWRLPGLVRKLQPHFRVITMDVRGHGLSDKPHEVAKYGIEMVNDVERLMDHLHIPKAHLVGYSMGGFITLKFASMHPDRLLSAMPCGAAWMTPSDPLCNLLNVIHDDLMGTHAPPNGLVAARRFVERTLMGAVMDLNALGCVAARFDELAITEADLRRINVPIMAVRGGREELVLGGSALKPVLPDYEECIVPGGRHSTVIFYAGFQQAILDFLLAHSTAHAEATLPVAGELAG